MKSIFILGDSIAMQPADGCAGGYGHRVMRVFADETQVMLIPDNGEDSRNILAKLDTWLAGRQFDVIHFNCGLHDIKRSYTTHHPQVPIEEYEANLRQIVSGLKQRARMLIWARTTPVVDGQCVLTKAFDRFNADVNAYNAVADRVMREAGIAVNDLHGAVDAVGRERCLSPDGVHMTEFSTQLLADKVTQAIRDIAKGSPIADRNV